MIKTHLMRAAAILGLAIFSVATTTLHAHAQDEGSMPLVATQAQAAAPEFSTPPPIEREGGAEEIPRIRRRANLLIDTRLHLTVATRGDVGLIGLIRVAYAFQSGEIGAYIGAGLIPSADDAHNRVFTPVAATASVLFPLGESAQFGLGVAGGFWAGATQATKFTIGALASAHAKFGFRLNELSTAYFGIDIFGFFGAGETTTVGPSLGFTFE